MFNDSMNSMEVFSIKNIIRDIAKNEIRHANIPTYIAAIVQKINDDGTINVYIPPNVSNSVTGLLNKCNEPLSVGDSVEIGTKDGSLSNCWVALKHGTTYPPSGITDLQEQINLIKKEIEKGIFERAYPVGSIYINAEDDTSPEILFGIGVWEKIEGQFLIGTGSHTDDNNETWTFSLGQAHGEYKHTLTINEMPRHSHQQYVTANTGNEGVRQDYNYDGNTSRYPQCQTGETGGNGAHNNMPPYLAVNMWKRIS